MSEPAFDVQVCSSGATVTVIPRGELDIATAGRLREALHDQESGTPVLILDLSRLEFIDVSGLGVVFDERRRAAREGFELRVVVGNGSARRLIELVGGPEILPEACD